MNTILLIGIIILILIYFTCKKNNRREKFTNSEINKLSNEILNKKDLFVPGVKYSKIKKNIDNIDPVMYNDIYHLALTKELSLNNIKSTIHNNIT
jgi:hypothetical protein